MTLPAEAGQLAGVGRDLAYGAVVSWPVHGLRHPPSGDTSGWYLWTGERSDAADFFVPLHPEHFIARVPGLVAELPAPPGTRFIIAPGHRDVWFDETLLLDR